MNEYEASVAIRVFLSERERLLIIAMIANALAEYVYLPKNTDMHEHIAKALDMSKLRDVLKR